MVYYYQNIQLLMWYRQIEAGFFLLFCFCATHKIAFIKATIRFARWLSVYWCKCGYKFIYWHRIRILLATYTHMYSTYYCYPYSEIRLCAVRLLFFLVLSFVNKWRHSVVQVYKVKSVRCACQAADKTNTITYHIHIRNVRTLQRKRTVEM